MSEIEEVLLRELIDIGIYFETMGAKLRDRYGIDCRYSHIVSTLEKLYQKSWTELKEKRRWNVES